MSAGQLELQTARLILRPWHPEGWLGPEIGWAIIRQCWGRGYATEGAAATMDWVFDALGCNEVIHCIAPDNIASQVVARRAQQRQQMDR